MTRPRCRRLFCRKPADVAVGRHVWCARHGLDHLAELKRHMVNVHG